MMRSCRFTTLVFVGLAAWLSPAVSTLSAEKEVKRYVRFQAGDTTSYGLLEGDQVRRIDGNLFGKWKPTDETHKLADVKLLVPTRPSKVIALAGNYKSHLAGAPEKKVPEPFFKVPSCLIATERNIVIPPGTTDVHHEGELVIVIGKRAKDVPVDKALDCVLGVTCGNDVSARDWQRGDVQWWRAKGSDTFGPCGPCIASGLNYDDLALECRVNGEVKQKERTSQLVHGVAQTVSWISRHVTLLPGDLIFTGTPGTTSPLHPGDVVEVEIEGVGVLRNPVVGPKEGPTKP
jgi:2-keto-4-pentenoate hydratase/2-oxohepta-3-ene-1,7-dioic acid hydratase in catechol pathway